MLKTKRIYTSMIPLVIPMQATITIHNRILSLSQIVTIMYFKCVYTLMIIVSPGKILFHIRIYACHMIIIMVTPIFELASVCLAQSQYNAYFSS